MSTESTNMEEYTPEEARKVLNMARSTFFKEVERGNIPSVLEPGRRRGRRYPKEAIDTYADLLKREKRPDQNLDFVKATNADIWEAVENARKTYGDDDIIPFRKALEWRSINNEMTMSMKENGRFAGCSTIMPLEEDILKLLIRDEMREQDIPENAIKTWVEPDITAYIASITIMRSEDEKKNAYRGRFLIEHTARWAIALYHQYDINKFYTIGTTAIGRELAEMFGFTEIISLENGNRKGYILKDMSRPSKLLAKFLREGMAIDLNNEDR
ncbi:MAG TPA: hypothetical protein VFV38_53090 [Ktedonobacteraceae bacterium]|nr:hypothetical protein [Ktedonobacteraceae bacterium]